MDQADQRSCGPAAAWQRLGLLAAAATPGAGLAFKVQDLGFRLWGLGFRV